MNIYYIYINSNSTNAKAFLHNSQKKNLEISDFIFFVTY